MDLKILVAFDKQDTDLRTPSSFSHGDSMQISTAKNIYCKYLPRPALSFFLSLTQNKRSQLVLSLCDTLFSIPNSPSTPYPHISHKMAVKSPLLRPFLRMQRFSKSQSCKSTSRWCERGSCKDSTIDKRGFQLVLSKLRGKRSTCRRHQSSQNES